MLMLASGNLLKPADGAPVSVPTQDMILGSYYLPTVRENDEGAGKVFRATTTLRFFTGKQCGKL